jgi:predicted secreted protein
MAALSADSDAFSNDDLTFIGFSEDGKYLAFEVFTAFSEAGDGDTWKTYIVDTVKNSFAAAPVVVISNALIPAKSEAAIRTYKQKLVPAVLRKFGIKRRNTGRRVVSRLFNEWSAPTTSVRESDAALPDASKQNYQGGSINERIISLEKITFRPNSGNRQNNAKSYELTLKTTRAMAGEEEIGNARLELYLRNKTKPEFIKAQILQKDGNIVPKSRDWALDYKIESVYLYKDKIAVFINVLGVGYEETAMSYMVVTGRIEE